MTSLFFSLLGTPWDKALWGGRDNLSIYSLISDDGDCDLDPFPVYNRDTPRVYCLKDTRLGSFPLMGIFEKTKPETDSCSKENVDMKKIDNLKAQQSLLHHHVNANSHRLNPHFELRQV